MILPPQRARSPGGCGQPGSLASIAAQELQPGSDGRPADELPAIAPCRWRSGPLAGARPRPGRPAVPVHWVTVVAAANRHSWAAIRSRRRSAISGMCSRSRSGTGSRRCGRIRATCESEGARPRGRAHQQYLRHHLQPGRRPDSAGRALRRLRAVWLRLSPLCPGAVDCSGRRRLLRIVSERELTFQPQARGCGAGQLPAGLRHCHSERSTEPHTQGV